MRRSLARGCALVVLGIGRGAGGELEAGCAWLAADRRNSTC